MNVRFLFSAMMAGLACATTPALAADLRVFLAPEGVLNPNTDSSPISGPPTLANPTLIDGSSPQRLYIWVQLNASTSGVQQEVKGLALNVVTTGNTQITDRRFFATTFVPAVTTRWHPAGINQGVIGPGGQSLTGGNLVSMLEAGITSGAFSGFDPQYNAATKSACIGWILVDGDGEIFLQVGSRGVGILDGGPADNIFLGFGDSPIAASAYNSASAQADATIQSGEGACCLPTGSCTQMNASECSAASGTFSGVGSSCDTAALNAVADGGFEGGTPNADWAETSTNFGTPLWQDLSGGAYEGTWWAWFGGIAAAETGSLTQTVTIASNATRLQFQLRVAGASNNAADFLRLLVGGNEVWRIQPTDAVCGNNVLEPGEDCDDGNTTSGDGCDANCQIEGTLTGNSPILITDATPYLADYVLVDLDLAAMPGGPYANGGAYEIKFDSTITGTPAITNFFVDDVRIAGDVCPCPADTNGDRSVNVTDLLAVISAWGTCAGCPPTQCAADINDDCAINVTDLLAVISAWGSCDPPSGKI